jgi:L-asparaginase
VYDIRKSVNQDGRKLMREKRKILLVCTGGTIASRQMDHGFAPGIGAEDLLAYVPAMREKYEIHAVQVCNIDSTNMTPEYWTMIVDAIEKAYDDYDGFVVCHGTDTMAYTSAALSYMIQNSDKPIVVTGAQKPIDLEITDAKTNLMDSILYAADEHSHGVSLVFGGNVIAGTRAKKMRAHSFNAFASVNFPNLALIQNEKIIRYIPQETFSEPLQITRQVRDSIAVLKLIPGSKPELLEYLFRNYDCLVIESFGVGGIPERLLQAFYNQMNQWISKGKIVVMATQVVKEGSNMEVYEVGQKVKQDFNLIEAYDMTLEATVTKLMYLMQRYGNDYDRIREGFYRTVNFDILYV